MKGSVRAPLMSWGLCLVPLINGFWLIFWKFSLLSELKNYLEADDVNPIMDALVWPILTCGLYNFYLPFKIGGLIERAQAKAGVPDAANKGGMFLLCMFLCASHVYLIQSEVNKAWEA